MGPTTATDVALLAVVVGVMALGYLIVHVTLEAVRAIQPARPPLPEADHPPAGLGRLVPIGSQVEQESRRGLVALELWLVARRRAAGEPEGADPYRPGVRGQLPERRNRGSAREAG